MNIIICGAGRVGFTIAKQLSEQGHSITVVDPSSDDILTGRENLYLHGLMYGVPHSIIPERIEAAFDLVQLIGREDDLVKTYSGGMRRRLELARGLLHHPDVLFLDEPTLGLDPQTRKRNWEHIEKIVKEKKVPVISPLGLDKKNQVFNINADTAAGAIAKKLNARRLIIMSDIEGVLDNDKKLISEINTNKINELIQNETIFGGMIPKIKNCLDVASNGVKGVVIIDGRKNHSILFELLSKKGSGSLIRK